MPAGADVTAASGFYERPILNSPYRAPALHHPLDDNGQPLPGAPLAGRRPSRFIVPVPTSRKRAAVVDSSWEQPMALALEAHPRVLAYAKNQALGFDIPYLDAGTTRRYIPDFLVRLHTGEAEPLNLVLEVTGLRDESDKAKGQTTCDLWVPGVNARGSFGRWAFAEFRHWTMMDEDFAGLVDRLVAGEAAGQ